MVYTFPPHSVPEIPSIRRRARAATTLVVTLAHVLESQPNTSNTCFTNVLHISQKVGTINTTTAERDTERERREKSNQKPQQRRSKK